MAQKKLDHSRVLLPSSCFSCVIDVQAWAPAEDTLSLDPEAIDSGFIEVGLISNHIGLEARSWRGRVRRLVRAWSGKPEPYLEFFTRSEAATFIAELEGSAEAAFPDEIG